jgi:hypothetical protein
VPRRIHTLNATDRHRLTRRCGQTAESGAADSCAVLGDGHVHIVLVCTFIQAAGSRIVEVAAQEAVLEDGFSARR